MKIAEDELRMIEAASALPIPVVMVSILGRPQQIKSISENVPAIVWAYLPGSEGAKAIVDVLFGDYNPSGKLPISFPKYANQVPIVYNARRYTSPEINTDYDPLFPFGFGLSYTTFEYSNLVVPTETKKGQGITVSVDVSNTGQVDGSEVVQVYLTDVYASVTRPLSSLTSYQKVFLPAQSTKTVTFYLSPTDLSIYDVYLNLIEEPRSIELHINNLSKTFTIL